MFLYSKWRTLPMHVRNDIAAQFDIPKSGTTHVDSNVIVSDGYKVEDIDAKLTVEAMQAFTGVEHTDMEMLWDLMVSRIKGEELIEEEAEAIIEAADTRNEVIAETAVEIAEKIEEVAEAISEEPKKRGRKPKTI